MLESKLTQFIQLIIQDLPINNRKEFLYLKNQICKKLKVASPTNADLREHYETMIQKKKIKRNLNLEKILKCRSIRTESGVAIVAVLTKHYPCPGKCIYCPTEKNMPKSYLSNEPAVMRAIMSDFDPYRQVQNRLRSLEINGHNIDKIELIVMGGTFSYLPKSYQKKFISECFRACNEYHGTRNPAKSLRSRGEKPRCDHAAFRGASSKIETINCKNISYLNKNLSYQQKKNEKARQRIVGLTLETRPDYMDEKEIINFRNLGCTRVELGVQSIFDDILQKVKRGHDVATTIKATKLLKNTGFKINYHIMPGLLGSDFKKDILVFQKLFNNPNFQPDMLKIYPTVVTENTDLFKLYKQKKYKPLTDKQFEKLVLKIKNEIIPPYVRISRIVRDIPTPSIITGPKISNLRQIIAQKSQCPCIRCREVKGDYKKSEKIILNRIDYKASDGKEIFLEYTSPNRKKLFALLRLRLPDYKLINKNNKNINKHSIKKEHFIPALRQAAIIRELHTYGKMIQINQKNKTSPQHIGLGKKLMKEAEKIVRKETSFSKITVISGIGVRDYYRKLGYRLQNGYMVKIIKKLNST